MDIDDLSKRFSRELERRAPIVDAEVIWPRARLRARTFVDDFDYPPELLTSARAVVFKGSRVVVVREIHGENHIEPGGGIEPGETIEQTVRREVAEECGWTIDALKPLGFHYLEPLTGEPPMANRRWGPMVHAIFVAEGLSFSRAARDMTQIEVGSRLTSIRRALAELRDNETALLRAAIARRDRP
ncbi:MAG TPA: NUDIX domain-containing protein [Caulobacteraceae bacterium]|nr:NUDIX domain-containing protein [Caulobacteraceae bacterium]